MTPKQAKPRLAAIVAALGGCVELAGPAGGQPVLGAHLKGIEFAVAREAANGVDLISIGEQDADAATRAEFSTKNASSSSGSTPERDALIGFRRGDRCPARSQAAPAIVLDRRGR